MLPADTAATINAAVVSFMPQLMEVAVDALAVAAGVWLLRRGWWLFQDFLYR